MFARQLFRIVLAVLLMGKLSAATFATFNVRYDNPGDAKQGNGWKQRAPVIIDLIRFHGFDVFGTQEGLPHQMDQLAAGLPDHDLVTFGRDDGERKGEHAGIFFRKDKYRLLDKGRFWLSQTPEKPSVGWDADLPRICTWAKLADVDNEKEFFFFNIHFDHRGNQSRLESAKLLLEKISTIAGESPVVLVGDFNSDQNSEAIALLRDSDKLADSHEAAPIKLVTVGTANRFDPDANTGARIDHLFLSGEFEVKRFGVLTDSYRISDTMDVDGGESSGNFPKEVRFRESEARLPSDHFPVVVVADWKS